MKIIPLQFGEIAVQEGYIDRKQLRQGLELQKQSKQQGRMTLLGEILADQGHMKTEDVTRILRMQQIYKTKLENEYFLHLAIMKKYLTNVQSRDMRKKYISEVSSENNINMATFSVTKNYLSMPLVEDIIKSSDYQNCFKLKLAGKTVYGVYELIGGVVRLKRTVIYKAMQVELERVVAVKTLQKEYETQEQIKRFFEEAKVTARFNHPNLVRIYDVGIGDNGYYYAMELVEGDNLASRLGNEGRLQVSEAVRTLRQIAKAMAHIHNHKMIHTQVNPRNIVIRDDGVAKLLDLSASCSIQPQKLSTGKLSKMPQYMAPEQMKQGSTLDMRTDIYALGATFYRILTGKPPFTGKSLEEVRDKILNQDPIPITEVDFTIPEDLAKIIHRMMRKDSNKRYPEIKNVLFALRKILI